ncbi:MAG: DUF427 domain-containing protein [Gammaproteobacteria bacterium]|nr:DUF427 domain-containing protein [Gammaproteobacteria bacterium]
MTQPNLPAENVWEYPRPPQLESVKSTIKIIHQQHTIACTDNAFRVLETAHPPTYYLPPDDIKMEFLIPNKHRSFCEWKGMAHYFDFCMFDKKIINVAWAYGNPVATFKAITGYLAFYASKLEECWVGGEKVASQAGDFYGGWITKNLTGPFKGEVGTQGW